jgi:hypothetical protein
MVVDDAVAERLVGATGTTVAVITYALVAYDE